jgi:hypothetical protein
MTYAARRGIASGQTHKPALAADKAWSFDEVRGNWNAPDRPSAADSMPQSMGRFPSLHAARLLLPNHNRRKICFR